LFQKLEKKGFNLLVHLLRLCMFVLFRGLRASPGVLCTLYCTVKLDEEKSKVAGLVHIIAKFAVAGKRV